LNLEPVDWRTQPQPNAARSECGPLHFHMLFLDGVYVDDPHKGLRFVRVKAPSHEELTALVGTIALRVGRKLERQGLLERDMAYGYLSAEAVDDDPMAQLQGYSITYRIAVGPWPGAPKPAARCSLFRPCRPVTRRTTTGSGSWLDSLSMPVLRQALMSETNWSACVGISAGLPWRRSGYL
jgi:hypothetical protein